MAFQYTCGSVWSQARLGSTVTVRTVHALESTEIDQKIGIEVQSNNHKSHGEGEVKKRVRSRCLVFESFLPVLIKDEGVFEP